MLHSFPTRSLQFSLKMEQCYLSREKDAKMVEIRKAYIVALANELLFRYRKSKEMA